MRPEHQHRLVFVKATRLTAAENDRLETFAATQEACVAEVIRQAVRNHIQM